MAPVRITSLPRSVSTSAVNEGDTAYFYATLSTPCNTSVAVSFETQDGTAKAGTNYVYQSGEAYFSPGETSATITVPCPRRNFQLRNEIKKWSNCLSNSG